MNAVKDSILMKNRQAFNESSFCGFRTRASEINKTKLRIDHLIQTQKRTSLQY